MARPPSWVPVVAGLVAILLATVVLDSRGQTPAPTPTAADLFDDSVLHEIRLVINSRDWNQLRAYSHENWYYLSDLRWRDMVVRNVGIRSRGRGSRSGTKPGLRVDINRYALNQEFLGLKSFILDNMTQDPSMLAEALSMRFFQRMGLPAPREAYARLYVNNEYVGLYAIVESIDKTFLGRVFGADDRGRVENDGHLFEYDWHRNYYFEYLGAELAPYVELFSAVTRESDPIEGAYRPIETMIRTLNQAPDARFEADMAQYLDLPLVMKHLAIENFIAELDGLLGGFGMNNFYFYRFERQARSQFLAWDKDKAFLAVDYPILQGVEENVLSRRAFRSPALRGAYLTALREAAASAMDPGPGAPALLKRFTVDDPRPGWLEREVARSYQQIRAAARADERKPYTNAEFEEAVEKMTAFARERSAFVRCQVARLLDPGSAAAECEGVSGLRARR